MTNLLVITSYLHHLDKLNTLSVNICGSIAIIAFLILLGILVYLGNHDSPTAKQQLCYGIAALTFGSLFLGSMINMRSYHTPAHTLALHARYTRQIASIKHIYPKLPVSADTYKSHYTNSVSHDAKQYKHSSKLLHATKPRAIRKYRNLEKEYRRTDPQKLPKNQWWHDI